MAYFSSRITQFASVAEVTYGTTPATPTFIVHRFLPSGGPQTDKQTEAVEDMHADANIRDDVELAQDTSGQVEFYATYGTEFETWLARALRGAWATNVLDNGVTQLPFTMERKHIAGASAAYSRFVGQEVDKFSIMMDARKTIRCTASIVGKSEATVATSAIASSTYTAANTNIITTGNSIVCNVFAGLSTIPKLKSFKLDIDHKIQAVEVLGSKYRDNQLAGLVDISGSVEAYIDSASPGDVHDLALNHSTGDINITFGSVANNKYTLDLAAARFIVSKVEGSGRDGALMATVNFTARYDGTNGSIRITKAVA